MAEEKYSEDYEKLLIYKQSLSSENFSEVEERTVDFFSDKYEDLIINYYNSFRRNLSQGASFEDKLDYEESKGFKIEIPPQEYFKEKLKEKYIPQALNSFNPEIITNKKDYCFATYLNNYFRHAVRDLPDHLRKDMSKASSIDNTESFEDRISNEMESARIRKKFSELQKELNIVELQILGFLVEGKKQKDMILINEETGNPYTKGYISKLVKKVRVRIKQKLEEP